MVRASACPPLSAVKFRTETGNGDVHNTRHRDTHSGNGGQAALHDRRRCEYVTGNGRYVGQRCEV
eukprot:2897805-Prymnesium_polylepis.1